MEDEEKKEYDLTVEASPKAVRTGLFILFGFVAMIISSMLITSEIGGAWKFCKVNEGEYELKFFPLPPKHLCSNEQIYNYGGRVWDFERAEINSRFENG